MKYTRITSLYQEYRNKIQNKEGLSQAKLELRLTGLIIMIILKVVNCIYSETSIANSKQKSFDMKLQLIFSRTTEEIHMMHKVVGIKNM